MLGLCKTQLVTNLLPEYVHGLPAYRASHMDLGKHEPLLFNC